ncbi:hypothetical protein MBOT_27660 [Mycobacterium botniense]|uniref:Uncharacterized protein n=1 Tax=Mycobacterium botniense TaxID=84962 RepID=A0A7I9Y009_9MYCO|nr:hypothetical protein MBOT_27660 [Mycobacterium botniense]
MPSNASPPAKGKTTETIAVAAHSAAITDAWASSPGRSAPPGREDEAAAAVTPPILPVAEAIFARTHPPLGG